MTTSSDGAWRYRETDLWRDLLQRTNDLQVALRAAPGQAPVGVTTLDQPVTDDQFGSVNLQ